MTTSAKTALHDIRVVELATGIAGPLAGMLLADQGADVLKLEPVAGDPARSSAGFEVWNRGKRSAVVDTSRRPDLLELVRVCRHANVVLVGTEPPGITYRLLRKLTRAESLPAVIVVPPYLLDETPWGRGLESDGLLQAYLGHAWNQASYEDVPVDCIYPLAIELQGAWAAAMSVASLLGPGQGRGQTVSVGGANGAMLSHPGAYLFGSGDVQVHRRGGPGGALPNYRCYRCKDGRWLFLGAFTNAFIARAMSALGAEHVINDPRLAGDPGAVRNAENVEWIISELEDIFVRRSRDEWLRLLNAADVPSAPVLRRDEWLDHPQVKAIGQRLTIEVQGRRVTMPGVMVMLERTPGEVGHPAPKLGPHLADLPHLWPESRGADVRGSASPNSAARPLAGTKVIDFGTIIAAPLAGSLFATLGADVIKVERPPLGDEYRTAHGGRGGSAYPAYNRGQRSLAIDLQSAEGREVIRRLCNESDIVIDNFRPGVLERLTIDWMTLQSTRPGIISASITTFGPGGPLGRSPGFDPLVQAISGIMRAQGGNDESDSPVFLTVPINDVLAAVLVVFGACCAALVRQKTGLGQRISVPLAAVTGLVQAEALVQFEGRPVATEGGRDFPGPSAFDRIYRSKDGFVRIAAFEKGDLDRLTRANLVKVPPTPSVRAITDAFSEAIGSLTTASVLPRLHSLGVAAVPVRTFPELIDDDVLARQGLLELSSRDRGGDLFVEPGRGHFVPGSEVAPLPRAPRFGQHSREVLADIGIGDGQVDELIRARVVFIG